MARTSNKYPPVLIELAEHLQASLVREGVKPEVADRVAFNAAEWLRITFAKAKFYVPLGYKHELQIRDWEIYSNFNGRNQGELCIAYDLTRVRLYQIIQ